ncbi:nuclear transport factor 2 family protein [Novosphingobium sp. PASSN1]|jgi:hypothetical protein|uniref:nuclear transport factor 2 family protein n=1 Tax=Novosphingobium sp. PASSN1 TaxID=2015561 RepID=UPI000BD2F8FE|nr:nuclear transport factor 2 family protein [Novosphingobium sp. PASSN1]OYU36432.1 MAG: hypothetical protein CFE35_03845 [Novosphingobium sp. PASSN1]
MQWWSDYFNDVDTMDPERFGAWFGDDIQLQFNNAPVIEGKAAVLAFLHEFTRNFSSLKHIHGQLVGDETSAAGEAMITFVRPDDARYEVRGVTMVARDQTGFRRMAIYADFSEIYAAVQGA